MVMMTSSLKSQGRPNAVKLHNFCIFVILVEVLPLVEFQLEPGISDEEAVHLIEAPATFTEESNHNRGWFQSAGDTFQTMQFDESPASIADPFTARLMSFEVDFFITCCIITEFHSTHVMGHVYLQVKLAMTVFRF
jgi:hypothetical protein